ncbi:hypothetical protein DFJ74DRAFT_687820 [Hyaloraphidium curvatum]|nr:hypothetical protein DFJ74DRAFT_687820 [Hyaloraphidium curvatum]
MPARPLRVSGMDAVLFTPPKYEAEDSPDDSRPKIFDETTGRAWKPEVDLSSSSTNILIVNEFLRQRADAGDGKPGPSASGRPEVSQPPAPPRPKFPLILYVTRSEEIADAFGGVYARPTDEALVNRGLLHLVNAQSYYQFSPEARRASHLLYTNFIVVALAQEDLAVRDAEEDRRFRAAPPARRGQLRSALNIVLDSILEHFGEDIDEERIILCAGPTGRSNWQTIWMAGIQQPHRFACVVPVTGCPSLGGSVDEDDEDSRGYTYWSRTVQLTAPELEHVSVVSLIVEPDAASYGGSSEFPEVMGLATFSISALALRHTIAVEMMSSLRASGNKKTIESKVTLPRNVKEKYNEVGNPYASVDLVKHLIGQRRAKKTVVKL